MIITVYAVIIFIISLLLFGIVYGIYRHKEARGTKIFALIITSCAFYCLFYSFQLVSKSPDAAELFFKLGHIGYNFSPFLFFWFASKYTERRINLVLFIILLFIPVLGNILLMTESYHNFLYENLFVKSLGYTVETLYTPGVWDTIHQINAFGIFIVVYFMMIRKFFKVSAIYRKQIVIILTGAFFPIIGHTIFHLSATGNINNNINITPYLLFFTSVVAYVGLTKYKLFHFAPLVREILFDMMSDGVVILDKLDYIIDINKSAMKILSLDNRAIGVIGNEVLPFWSKVEYYIKKKDEYKEINSEDDGKNYELILSKLDESGRFSGYMIIIRDITEKKRLLEIEHNSKKLESIGILAGGIAHDFNNLLAGLFGSIELARLENKNTQVDNHLRQAVECIEDARVLTRQLLTFSKGGEPAKVKENISLFLKERVEYFIKRKDIKIEMLIPDDLWEVKYDKQQITQVVDNILSNSLQAISDDGVITLQMLNIVIASRKEHPGLKPGYYVKISFKDNGSGIPKNALPYIFDPFFTTKECGHGLGLATCYSIVNRHEGAIELESEPGTGSTFHIYLPAVIRTT